MNCSEIGSINVSLDENNDYKYCFNSTTEIDLPENGYRYYPLSLDSVYTYPNFIHTVPNYLNFGLIKVSKKSITQIIDQGK